MTKENNGSMLDALNKSVEDKIGKRQSPMSTHSKTTKPVRVYEDIYDVLRTIAFHDNTKIQAVTNHLIMYALEHDEKYHKLYKQVLEEINRN